MRLWAVVPSRMRAPAWGGGGGGGGPAQRYQWYSPASGFDGLLDGWCKSHQSSCRQGSIWTAEECKYQMSVFLATFT